MTENTPTENASACSPGCSAAPGIPCPACGTIFGRDSVLFTRQALGQILRVRKCKGCRRRVRTAEQVVPGIPRGRDEEPPATA